MSTSALVHLLEYQVSWKQLRRLPDEHVAAVAILCFSVSEVNALARIYLASNHTMIDEKAINSAIAIQQMLIIRTWSSKLFEVQKFLRFGGKKPNTKDATLRKLGSEALERFLILTEQEGFEVAGNLRDEAAHHYSFEAAKKNLGSVESDANCNFYLHDQNGNSFFPLGEEVMFDGRLNRRWKNVKSQEDRDELFMSWLNWCLAANEWLQETHAIFTNSLVFGPLDNNRVRKRTYWVPPRIVGGFKEAPTPIFRKRSASK